MRPPRSPCPKCSPESPGKAIYSSGTSAPPKKYYMGHVGPPGPAVVRYRCDQGHTWTERDGEQEQDGRAL
jgi:hypothetical protein